MKTLHTIYNNFAKRNFSSFRLLLIVFLTLTVTINAWGAEVTFNKSSFSSSDKTETKEDVTLTFDAVTINKEQIRFASNQKMVVTSSAGNITRIDVKTNSTETYISPLGNTVSSGSWYKSSVKEYYWSGAASSVTLTPNAAIRITEVKVTYNKTSAGEDDNDTPSDNIGGTYTIKFATGNNTNATTSSVQLSTMIAEGSENVMSFSVDATDKYVYHKGAGASNAIGSGLRLGKSGAKGKITFNLSEQISSKCLSSISVTTGAWDTNTTVSLLLNGDNSTLTTATAGNTLSYTPQELTKLSSITLSASARAFIKTITIETTQCTTETTITLNPNGGTGTMGDVTTENGTLTLPKCTFTREGYTFAGWATSANGEVAFADEEVVSNWDADITELFAKWTAKTITITWDANGGSVNPTSSTYTYNGATITLPIPTRTGYSFNGWFTATTGGTQITEVGTTNKPTENVTYYAQWTAIEYTIIYNDTKGATNSNPATYTIEDEITFADLTNLPKGYNFTGWDPASIAKGSTGDQIVTAQWTEKALTRYRTDCNACIPLDGFASIDGTFHFFPGETITLTVTPPADAVPYIYQWQKLVGSDWTDIAGAITTIYTKDETTIADAGRYRCVVSSEGYCDAIAEYDVKCLQLYVYYDNKSDVFNAPLKKVDGETATIDVELQNAGYTYYFKITDGCGNWYGFNGDIHSGWCTDVQMNADAYCGLQTTKFGTYVFNVNYFDLANLKVSVLYPSAYQAADKVIYLDNNVLKWTNSNNAEGKNKIYYRIGRSDHNSKHAMTLVPGTANLYKVTTGEYDNFDVWHIANNGCWSDGNSIYKTNTGDGWAATQATVFETLPVTLAAVTVTPTDLRSKGGDDNNNNCDFYNYDITEGMKTWNADVIEPTNGTITVKYTHHDGTIVDNFTSGEKELAHTCLLTITATPNVGYSLTLLTVNDEPFTSGNIHTLTADAVIKATFTINNYNVTWKLNGGNIGDDESDIVQPYQYGAAIESPEKPTYDCHEFVEWNPAYTVGMTMPDDNLEFTAVWNKLSYTITFQNWDGTELQSSTIECGETPSYTGAKPTREQDAMYEYEFADWTPTVAEATGDQTYTATYDQTKRQYTVTWFVDGKQIDSKSVAAGDLATSPEVNPIPCGAVLAGWTDAENGVYVHGTSTLYEGAQPSIVILENKTFYAVFADRETIIPKLPENIVYWENQEITAGSDIAATIGDGNMTSNVTLDDERDRTYYGSISKAAQISLENLNLRDYNNINLSFWARGSAKGTFTIVTDVNNDPIGTVTLTEDERLYIIENIPSDATSITLTYSASSGSLFFGMVKIYENTSAVGTFTKLTAENTNGWTGSDWDGYYLITNDQNNLLALDGNAIGEKSYQLVEAHDGIISSPIKTAFWVSYDEDEPGYSIKGVGDELYLGTENKSVSVSKEPVYHQMIGYNQLKDFNNRLLSWNNSGSKFGFYGLIQTSAPQMYKIMSELSNHRTLCTYNIEYTDLEGATHSNPVTYTAANLPLTFTTPSAREGYTFAGWKPASLDENARGDQEVEAQWTVNQYTVTWKPNGGKWSDSSTGDKINTHNYGATITTYVAPTRTGYTFTGWSPAEIPETMPAENLEFTAQWEPTTHTVTWKIGETIHATSTVSIESPLATAPENPTDGELGCCADKFMGWSSLQSPSAGDIFTKDNIPSNVTTAKTYYAVFATTAQGVGTSIVTFSEMGYENGTAVTDQIVLGDGEGHGDATITLAKAQSSSNNPTYYNEGEAVRIYAGGTITIASTYNNATIKNITFAFGTDDGISAITPDKGNYSAGTWTGDAQSVTFTISGSTGHRRIASIQVTTGVTGSQYTNYVTHCTALEDPALSGGSVSPIAVDCGKFSTLNNSQAITFATMQDLTCPVTFEVTEGDFLISTAKDKAAQYQSKITVTPTKSGSNIGHLKNVYVRANATDHNESFTGKIKVTSGEIDAFTINLEANVTCVQYTLKTVDHLGNETLVGTYFADHIIENAPAAPTPDDCSTKYTFDGWSTTEVKYGSLVYNKVTFPYTMPAENVTLIPVYRLLEDISKADYHRVTSDLGADDVDGNNWAGDYLIAASAQIVADGSTSDLETINGASIDENIVPASFGNLYYVSLIAVDGGYVLKTQENKNNEKPYVYITPAGTSTTTNANLTTADNNPLSVTYNSESDILITNPQNTLGYALEFYSTKFGFYKAGSKIYLYRKSPLYTTSLICGTIEIQENDIVVTSTKDQSVKVSVPVKLTSSYDDAVTVSGANVNSFSIITKESVPVNTEEVVNVELVYSPLAYNQHETETITLTATNGATTSFQITGRSLPESFAIVAKVGNVWYALPSQGLNSETTPVGYPVKVDNNDNPTAVTSLPITAEWSLRNVYKVNGQNDRFTANGENLVFVNTENKTLYANNGNANIQTYAEYTNYATTNPERYEWVPTTTDLTNYTLKNVGRDKDLSINVNATFGTHASNIASNNLRFLPINATYNPFDMQVVEWYPTKVLVQTEAVLTSVSAIVGGIAVANPVVTKKGGKLYEISGLPLESNPTKILTISYDTYSCSKVIPIIISRATKSVTDAPFTTLTTSVYNYSDLVVRDGATLTINGTKQAPDKFVNVTIYPTAKIVVPENKQLSVYSLTFFGGISEIYNGSTYDINKYGVPQLSLKGTLGKTVTTMDYIMRVNLDQMYQVGVPYDVNLNEITYWDGASIALGTALYVSAYDGAARARLDWDNTWQWEVNFVDKVLKAGIGYTISAEPQVAGDTYSILRMPMKNNINSGNTETQKATINVTAHGMSDENLTDNHKGWNYLSNPYMTSISGAESGGVDNNNIVVGYLVETGKGPWEWKKDTYRYVTIPYDDGTNYYQRKFSEATLLPFKSFFLQIANSGDLSFALASRLNAPMRHLQQQENAPREVEFELLLSNDAQSDNTGLLISEEFTPAYEINADLEKMTGTMSVYTIYNGYQLAYNALSPLNAMEEIPLGYVVPTTGEYTFNLDERGDLDDIEHIYLLDHDSSITTDLMEDIYTFTATEKKNDQRFAISVILKAEEEEETPTHLETLEWESDHPYKFIYQDKMYILRNGVIYDAMGKQVQTINK